MNLSMRYWTIIIRKSCVDLGNNTMPFSFLGGVNELRFLDAGLELVAMVLVTVIGWVLMPSYDCQLLSVFTSYSLGYA